MTAHEDPPEKETSAFWEDRYASTERVWSGRVNGALARVASSLQPGTALDLACGEGGDVLWLAEQGWNATGIDFSPTAVDRATAEAFARGLAQRAVFLVGDLDHLDRTITPPRQFDLVTMSFLQTKPGPLRDQRHREAARLVAPNGHLLITSHADKPPWATHGHSVYPTPEADVAGLALDDDWTVVTAEVQGREAIAPDGSSARVDDVVVLVRRDPTA